MEKRFAAFILICLLVSAFFPACGGEKPPSSEVDVQNTESESPGDDAAETTEEGDKPDVMNADYEKAIFNILYPSWSLYNSYYFADENNGEAVNDAIYDRTIKLEEAMNIDMTWITKGDINTISTEVNKTVTSGMDSYQLALTHCATDLVKYPKQGLVVNWLDVPGIDLQKSYWNQSIKDRMTISGVLPFCVNSFILPDVNSIFFNTLLNDNYVHEDLYKLTLDGKWTWDKLAEYASVASLDIDGDSEFTENDQYGFVAELGWQFASVPVSCGQYIITADPEQGAVITINTEKTVNIIDKFKTMLYSGNSAFIWEYSHAYDPNIGGIPPIDFNAGKALFYLVPLSLASNFREMDTDFGILPLPKYDETQENYETLNWSGFMIIPVTAGDLDMIGTVVENLGYLNDKIVLPAFYEILLGQKVSRNEESSQMLDIIFDGSVYDLGVNLGLYTITQTCCASKNAKDFASYYEKNIKSWTKTVNDYTKACEEYAQAAG
ncbi:MAG: hypothetical protein ACOX4O_00365 [Eubacteriales bacterium]